MNRWLLIIFIFLFSFCKSKYQKAFEELDKREYYFSPEEGITTIDEIELLSNVLVYKPSLISLYFDRGEHYQFFEEYEKAIQDYKTSIEKGIVFGRLLFQKGECELKLKNYDRAISDFTKAYDLMITEWEDASEFDKSPNHWGSPYGDHLKILDTIKLRIEQAEMRKSTTIR